jgi:hypothetical protein
MVHTLTTYKQKPNPAVQPIGASRLRRTEIESRLRLAPVADLVVGGKRYERMSEQAHYWGTVAAGRHGSIAADLLEPVGHEGPWLLQLSGKDWHFAFGVAGASTVRELCRFVNEHVEREVFAEYRAGSFQTAEVFIVKDSEFADRFWLRIRGADQMAEVTIQDEDAVAFGKALEDLLSDLAS